MSGWSGDPQWGGPPPPRRGGGEQGPPPAWEQQPQPGWGGQQQPPGWGGQQHGVPGGQHWTPPPSRRSAPVWVVVLVGVLALLVGLGVGGAIGFVAGMASQLTEEFTTSQVGPDAERGGGDLSGTHDVGGLRVGEIDVQRDFADDFEARATVTNPGPEPYDGGAIEIHLLRGGEQLGSVSGSLSALGPGESEVVELWGFDDYVDGVDRVEILVD